MQYYGGENTCTNRMRYAQKVKVSSCLADSAGRADRRVIVVEPRLRNLPKHKQ